MYSIEDVQIKSQQESIAGKLFLPFGVPKAVVTILGPVAFSKEQSPIQYATRLAKEGFMVLIFDPRHYGASEGMPRRFESRKAKVEDVQASVDYLLSRKEAVNCQIVALGICQGSNWIIEAANRDPRIHKVVLIAAHLLTPETAQNYCGGQQNVTKKLENAAKAKELYEQTGEVLYIPIVRETDEDKTALLQLQPIAEWYLPWANHTPYFAFRGTWENKITQMSELDIWGHDVTTHIALLQQPVLMIHSDRAATGTEIPRKLFEKIPSKAKKLTWLTDQQVQFQFYEDPLTIDKCVQEISCWL